eukprot:TRINITY_DN45581_c0_g1_i1.p1 TRINITY_DN45581_c0_g1~~TRINITY_DN45581_c0_g1_i1.p1  ORF type:complete len:761 (-),score=84.56 TRINITY_DN45581_c0_g1_i1:67-2349(-)
MSLPKDCEIETICIHGGYPHAGDGTTSRAVPLHRTTSYQFKNVKHAADLFALSELGNIYTRIGNPTLEVLEKRLALMHGGPELGCLAVASGTVAVFNAVLNVAAVGDNIISANNLYGGTMTMFAHILPKMGITVTFVDPKDPENFSAAVNDRTRAFFCQTCSNPALDISDLKAISTVAHWCALPLIVDDTFTTAYLQRPFDHGVDVVVTSLTKWTGGHGTAIGGCIIDGGSFDWAGGKHPLYDEPDSSYHWIRWGHDLPANLRQIAFALRLRTNLLRNTGASMSPDNAWMFLQGIETLPMRMDKHCSNALVVAEYLKNHSGVEWVRYPGLLDDPMHTLSQTYLKGTGGSMVVFGCKGGKEASGRFIDALTLVSHVANVGDAKTLAINPATTTHSQMTEEEMRTGGVPPELVRLSVGIENPNDILRDLEQALQFSQAGRLSGARFTAESMRENRRIPMFPRVAELGTRSFHYNIFGPITRIGHQQPPLVCIGGWGMVKEEWGKLAFEISGTRDVLTFDNQGIGGSLDEASDPFSLESWCNDIVRLAEQAFGANVKFGVIGYSMGAFAAQHLAASQPERIVSAVLIGAQGNRKTAVAGASEFFKHSRKTMADGQNTVDANDRRLRHFFDHESIAAERPEDWEAFVKQSLRFRRPASVIDKQMVLIGTADVDLSKITCPVLVVTGDKDVVVPAANSQLVVEQLSCAARKELVVMPGQGHQCWGICPPKQQLSFQARDTPLATHALARHIQHFLAGDSLSCSKL